MELLKGKLFAQAFTVYLHYLPLIFSLICFRLKGFIIESLGFIIF